LEIKKRIRKIFKQFLKFKNLYKYNYFEIEFILICNFKLNKVNKLKG
jgi:hypothetical protein